MGHHELLVRYVLTAERLFDVEDAKVLLLLLQCLVCGRCYDLLNLQPQFRHGTSDHGDLLHPLLTYQRN